MLMALASHEAPMSKTTRRGFLQAGLALGAAGLVNTTRFGKAFAGASPGPTAGPTPSPDIVVAKGSDAFALTTKAVEALGGMKRFVARGARVGLLINAPAHWRLEGSHTRMEVSLAVAKMCLDAGAKEIVTLPTLAPNYWKGSPLAERNASVIGALKECSGKFVEMTLGKTVALKTVQVRPELLEVDVLINIPVAKHHEGTNFTGNLKNMMGGLNHETNYFFHTGSGKSGYEDVDFLSQCVADLNTLRRQQLCVVDATTVLGSNGPAGPGDLLHLNKVVVGTDPVAVDACCVALHGRKASELVMLAKAEAAGVGHADLGKLTVRELAA
jgi:uncharacterized protein (DUF362 family)